MTETFYRYLDIPDACHVGNRVYKKLFYENIRINAPDKKAFSEDIVGIEWRYALKPETIQIARYEDEEREYHEIAVIQVTLKSPNRYKRIADIIQRAIPYPVVLVFLHESRILINLASKRINRADAGKIMVEAFYSSPWIDPDSPDRLQGEFLESCIVSNLPFTHFRDFHDGLIRRILALNCGAFTGEYTLEDHISIEERIKRLEILHALEQKIAGLKKKLKSESQFNRQVDLNVEIKRLEKEIERRVERM